MPNSLIFCIPVKNCIINRTATLDRPQGLEPQNHFDPSLLCLPPKGRTSNFLASHSLILQCLSSLIATLSSVTLPQCLNGRCRAMLRSPRLSTAQAAEPPPRAQPGGLAPRGPCYATPEATLAQNTSKPPRWWHGALLSPAICVVAWVWWWMLQRHFPILVEGQWGFTRQQLVCSQDPSLSPGFVCFLWTC